MATPPQLVMQDIPAGSNSKIIKPEIDVLNPFPPVEVILLDQKKHLSNVDEIKIRECTGERLPGFSFTALPVATPADHEKPGITDTSKSKPTTVFVPDERFTFADSNFPWSLVGKVRTASGFGSGTVIGPRHVLTASHVVNWTRDAGGNIGWISFTPAYFDGRGPWGEFSVRQVYAWRENSTLTLTDEQVAFDYAVLVLHDTINDKVGGFASARGYDASWNGQSLWQTLGYPADLNNGERPAYQGNCIISSKQDHTFGGNTGSVLGHFNDIFGGQSGGPVWGTWAGEPAPSVVGVQSTEPFVPQLGSTNGDNQYAGGQAMLTLVDWVKTNVP